MSVNIELPSQQSLSLLAPDKTKQAILQPMGFIRRSIEENREERALVRSTPRFVPAGQSTQMIIGATGENDLKILSLSERLYQTYKLKRVFFSAYIPMVESSLLPSPDTKPPLLREHRLYQADWLLRYYGFSASELLDEQTPNFNPYLDPKCNWALRHPELFPVEVTAAYQMLAARAAWGCAARSACVAAAGRAAGCDWTQNAGRGYETRTIFYHLWRKMLAAGDVRRIQCWRHCCLSSARQA